MNERQTWAPLEQQQQQQRDAQTVRGLTAVAAAASGIRANLVPFDRITGGMGGVVVRLSVPAAAVGDIFADFYCGSNLVASNWSVPVEEFVGAGPNLRQPAVTMRGGRGDLISIVYRNGDAANATSVTHDVSVLNVGR